MKKISVLAVVVLILGLTGCKNSSGKQATASSATSGGVAATVGGESITMEELDKAAKSQLQKMDTEIYQIKKRVLDGLVETRLIEEAAKKKGVSAEKFMAEEIDAKIKAPTEEEIKSFYDGSKDRIGKPIEEVKGQITDYLKQNRKSQAKNELIVQLKKDAQVKIAIEPPRIEIDVENAPSVGDKDAKVTLVEFSDYQCPFCKRVRPTIWRLMDEYKGKLRYVWKDFPLSFHKDAKKAHEAALCAGDQKKYFEYNRKIFDNQSNIAVADLKKYAKELQLNTKDFDKCLDTSKHAKDIEDSVQAGIKVGVSGTPAYFINGMMLSGAMPYESFKELIDSEVNK